MRCSLYKLDFTNADVTLALVGFGDDVLEMPVFAGAQQVQAPPLVRADYPKVLVRGNVPRVVTFDRVHKLANAYLAQQFQLTHLHVLDVLKKGDLTIQVETQTAFKISDGALTGEPIQSDELMADEVAFRYMVYGGKIEIIS